MYLFRRTALAAALLLCSLAPAAAQGGWGALAFSENGTAFGYSHDYNLREEAEYGALSECARFANDCKIFETFQNRCVVLAGSPEGTFGWAIGTTGSLAQQRIRAALEQCQRHGGTNCRLVVQFCSGISAEKSPSEPPKE